MTSAGSAVRPAADAAAYRAVEHIYHSYLTGLILMLASRAGAARAAEVVFRTFRRQQLARFLPGLKKLGLDQLPHAVACAQYHYLSNQVGGVKVEYVYESDTKAWVRYPPPRWIWSGTAICGIPSEVSRAMLRGWHANNGVVLGNPRLGFVCTGQTVDGQPGLEGYYKEWDHDLAPEERLQFSPGERCPPFQADLAPRLPGNTWPEERLQKVLRNYAMEYVTSIVPETIRVLGPEEGGHLAGAAARLVGMHTFDEVARLLGGVEAGAAGFAKAFARLARGQDDDAELQLEGSAATVRQTSWRLMAEREALSPAVFDAWNELWVGAALAHDRFMRVDSDGTPRPRRSLLALEIRLIQNEKAAPGRCHSRCLERAASGLRHRDLDAADFALGVDLHDLLVAIGLQIQVCGKSGRLDEHVDLAAACGALQVAEDIPALLAPVTGDALTLAGDVAGEIEFVAVAGAVQILLQAEPVGVDLVVGLATDVLGGAVGERDRAGAAPVSVKAGKRAPRLGMACGDRQHERGADAGSCESLTEQAGTKQFHCSFPIK